jgi:hypothetical protein
MINILNNNLNNNLQNKFEVELYKPCGLNFYTILFFFLPIIVGFNKDCPQIAWGSVMCFITGLLYHGTYNKYFKIIDQIIIMGCLVYFIFRGTTMTIYFLGTITAFIMLIVGYKLLSFSKNGILFHSMLHCISSIGIYFLIEGCIESKCPLYVGIDNSNISVYI